MSSNVYKYLKEIRYAFYTQKFETKYFILGNSSCDIDSTISAYLLSIGKNIRHKTVNIDDSNTVSIVPNCKSLYIPVLNCKRGEISSRLDIKYVLKRFHIDEDDFFYMDDYELSEKSFKDPNNNYKVILVDHSILIPEEVYLSPYVVEIYDHHFNLDLKYPNLIKKTIKYPCGSCSILILFEYFLTKFPHSILPPLLAVTAVLVDTENFKPVFHFNRWTDMDKMIYDRIVSEIQPNIDLQEYYAQLEDAKLNVEENLKLGYEVLFKKDFKAFQWGSFSVHWSSLQVSLGKIVERFSREKILEYINQLKDKRNLFVCNSAMENKNKEFVFVSLKGDIDLQSFTTFLQEKMPHDFIKAYHPSDKEKNIVKVELNERASRKSTEPFFNEYFSKLKSE